ncbi:MAG: hypothetical protein AAFP99_11615 [Pseudomonadota bacterium]
MIRSFIAASALLAVTWTAHAEVRIGKGVRIGGHEIAPQTFTEERNGVFYIYQDNPKNPGCRWRNNGDGTRTKICHLKRK